jgi:thiol-disulfide isomerase/thioredoxin|tara:strand:+ start:3962 stop:4495 length:534 start_codon:yes stop_codon:yes gene_type:complete
MNTNKIVGIVFVFLLIVGGIIITQQDNSSTSDKQGIDTLLNLSFTDYTGNTVNLADFKGTPLVINSWAVWCPFCLQELPDFAEVQKEFGEQITVIVINRAESLEKVENYTDDLGITDDLVFLLDPSDSFYRAISGFSMPETIFVDSQGIIQEHKRGFMIIDEIRQKINNLLSSELNT